MDDLGAGTLLRTLVADEPPPSRIDPRRAISGAKRRRRRRLVRFLLAGVMVVAVGVVGALVPVVREDRVPVATPQPQFNLSPTHVFDPTRFGLTLDWRAEGVTVVEQESAGSYQRITLLRTVDSKLMPLATISAYGSGQISPNEERPARSTASIYGDGQPSHWMPQWKDQPGQLWWWWAPAAWAVIEIHDSSESADLAIRLARALRTDESTPVRMPFTVPTPAGLRLARAATMSGPDGVYAAQLKFAREPRYASMGWVSVTATNDPAAVATGKPYVMGGDGTHDARIPRTPVDGVLTVRTTPRDLVGVETLTSDGSSKPLLDRVAARQTAMSVRLVGNPADSKNWTRHFVR